MNKKIVLLFCSFLSIYIAKAQDIATMLKEANNFEILFKEPEALEKYKQILLTDNKNLFATIKVVELNCRIGKRNTNKISKRLSYETALAFAKTAFAIDSNSSQSLYAMALASARMTEVETENKKVIAFAKDTKQFADKALLIDPKNAMANFIEGKWHFEMITLNWAKQLAVKAFYGGLPQPNIDKCIAFFETTKKLAPLFVENYLALAKAYKYNNMAVEMIATLKQLVKLPKRKLDDASFIAEGEKMLQEEM
jgi:hypothetical protein